ncbi:type VI secretion system Vgr family protein [Paraburkholderia sp. J10-1]|uniref:type VI secretion system Vgr family protein n=1 Tax=Paraburkholderia sp. J10-1 TaxID=2805430 RepID=UPI002AB76583|nr:type VI secretion system tip protein TssI/VgrG [Paraburkholderia sp. J10-1]
MDSAASQITANRRFDFRSSAFAKDNDKFEVVEMEGFESISRPFRFTLTLSSSDAAIDFDLMLRNPATFTIYGPERTLSTPYHGVLAEFEQLHRADGYVFYRAVLVPRLWRLSLYRLSEVYLQEQTIPELIESILKKAKTGGPDDFEFNLKGSYRQRSFVCQYEETDLDFISRWMEKEGIYYYFDHSGKAEKLLLIDDKIKQAPGALKVSYRPDDTLDTGVAADSVRNLVCRQKPLPEAVVLQDYNYCKANVDLTARKEVSADGFGEVTIYGENFLDADEGIRYASLRAEEIICGAKVFSGEGVAVGLRSGYAIELTGHYRGSFNGSYLVTEVHHEGSQAGAQLNGVSNPSSSSGRSNEIVYRNSFRAIPLDIQFRAERVTAKPRVAGTMNAKIDSEGKGEYADLDEFGQYKVQLLFDKTDKDPNKGSARLRMATPYSGTNHGMHFPLHKDAEVLLSFIDGDPDQPVIVGSLPNSENPNVVTQANESQNVIETAGGNRVQLDDAKGDESIWLHSPAGKSSIGIGSTTMAGGDGSLWFGTAGSSGSLAATTTSSISGIANSVVAGVSSSVTAGSISRSSFAESAISRTYTRWVTESSETVVEGESYEACGDKFLKADKGVLILGGIKNVAVAKENSEIRWCFKHLSGFFACFDLLMAAASVIEYAATESVQWGKGDKAGATSKSVVGVAKFALARAQNLFQLKRSSSGRLVRTGAENYKSSLSLNENRASLVYKDDSMGGSCALALAYDHASLEVNKSWLRLKESEMCLQSFSHDGSRWSAIDFDKKGITIQFKDHDSFRSGLDFREKEASLKVSSGGQLFSSGLEVKENEISMGFKYFGKEVLSPSSLKIATQEVSMNSQGTMNLKAGADITVKAGEGKLIQLG